MARARRRGGGGRGRRGGNIKGFLKRWKDRC
jgi:hypothetical protein